MSLVFSFSFGLTLETSTPIRYQYSCGRSTRSHYKDRLARTAQPPPETRLAAKFRHCVRIARRNRCRSARELRKCARENLACIRSMQGTSSRRSPIPDLYGAPPNPATPSHASQLYADPDKVYGRCATRKIIYRTHELGRRLQ